MRLLRDTHIDFMKYRKFWISVSVVLMLIGFFAIFVYRDLNLGIDFAGGTQATLRFAQAPRIDQLRSLLAAAGLGEAEIQRFGDPKDNEVVIKTAAVKGSEEGSLGRITGALNRSFNPGQAGRVDLNQASADDIAGLLLAADPDHVAGQGPAEARAHYGAMGTALRAERSQRGIYNSWDDAAKVPSAANPRQPALTPAAVGALRQRAMLGPYGVLGVENVGPQVGKELRQRGIWAVVLSLLGMLVYIWLRFELRFGIGAIMASVHDVLITLGLFTLMRFEFNLTTVAAFLTLVGYSMNDTVVIFDRIRENMRKNRRKPLLEVMNESINQTLSRTIMTSGLTMLTVASLLAIGGDVLRGFSFVMTVGIIVGTYSSIYIASPFALLWEQLFGKSRARREGGAGAGGVAGAAGARPGSRLTPDSGTGA
ncbi:MAG TPA: protein translocase subunit SecF, partial [Dongiaceae bacterium]